MDGFLTVVVFFHDRDAQGVGSRQKLTFSGQSSTYLIDGGWIAAMGRVVAARTSAFALLLGELGLAPAIAAALEDEDLDVVGESVDEGDGARGIGEDGVPVLEGQVGGDEQGAVLVAAADELEEEVGGASVVGEVSELIDHEQRGAGVVAEAAFEGAGGLLSVEVEEEVGGGGEEGGVPGEDGLVGDVLGEHGLTQALRTDEDYVLAAGEEVEREDAFEGGTVQCGGPVRVPIGERFEASEACAGESALEAAALSVFEFGGDEVFEEHGGAPALAGGRGDAVVEVVGGAVEPEAAEVSRQRRRGGVG